MTEKSDNSRKKCWLAENVAPLLAILAVLSTFALFVFFIITMSKTFDEAERKFDKAQNELVVALKKPDSDKQIQVLENAVGQAKSSLDAAKECHGTVKEIILYILGVLSSTITTIFGYYFGSSKSSSNKDATMRVLAQAKGDIFR